jgi:hypothetical protein
MLFLRSNGAVEPDPLSPPMIYDFSAVLGLLSPPTHGQPISNIRLDGLPQLSPIQARHYQGMRRDPKFYIEYQSPRREYPRLPLLSNVSNRHQKLRYEKTCF